MDITSIVGLVLAFVLVAVVMIIDGGSPAELFAAPQAILLTMGGAIVAAVISMPMKDVIAIPKYFMKAFLGAKIEPHHSIEMLTRMADKARREGLLSLEDESKKLNDEFLKKGLMLVVDGVDPAQVRAILDIEIHHMKERHETTGIAFFTAAGGYGPTMGIIGTVMGLITVLKELSNPAVLGEKIAVAFLATLWGILSANIIWLPLAGKLKVKSEEEILYRLMLMEGILAIQSGENPRIVREKLCAFLPPKERPVDAAAQAAQKAKA